MCRVGSGPATEINQKCSMLFSTEWATTLYLLCDWNYHEIQVYEKTFPSRIGATRVREREVTKRDTIWRNGLKWGWQNLGQWQGQLQLLVNRSKALGPRWLKKDDNDCADTGRRTALVCKVTTCKLWTRCMQGELDLSQLFQLVWSSQVPINWEWMKQ